MLFIRRKYGLAKHIIINIAKSAIKTLVSDIARSLLAVPVFSRLTPAIVLTAATIPP
jgi:hypothetical protein